jgi:hypothetical protein
VPARLAAVVVAEAEAEDPRSAVVAQVSFWWRGGALPVERGSIGVRVIRCVARLGYNLPLTWHTPDHVDASL